MCFESKRSLVTNIHDHVIFFDLQIAIVNVFRAVQWQIQAFHDFIFSTSKTTFVNISSFLSHSATSRYLSIWSKNCLSNFLLLQGRGILKGIPGQMDFHLRSFDPNFALQWSERAQNQQKIMNHSATSRYLSMWSENCPSDCLLSVAEVKWTNGSTLPLRIPSSAM